ncbi:MAG: hypothetical protein ACRDKT_07970 [Actinomycetota bacterium]
MANRTETLERVRERALEVGVYLPLGAYAAVRDEISELDSRRIRKLYNGLIDRGQNRLEPVERNLRRRARRFNGDIEKAGREVRTNVRKGAKRANAAVSEIAPKLPRVAAPKKASELPIKGYNSLTVSEITSQLKGLTQTDLAKVYKWERNHENRSTILESIESKFVDLPIPTYDALTVDEITSRIDGLSQSELKTIRRYENDTKKRATVLERIDAQIK